MPPKFGTSGLRGLVVDLTPELIARYVGAFLTACPVGNGLFVGRDLRDSSPQISNSVIAAARSAGIAVTDCGATPTPALALAAMSHGAAAIMVTGSHIPADRNGLKFYTPEGEITKADEAAILGQLDAEPVSNAQTGQLIQLDAAGGYIERYLQAFPKALVGQKIGLFSHSAVGRDLMQDLLSALGAEVIELGRTNHFVPVDTEAVSAEQRSRFQEWSIAESLDAILSTDGDGDRPLLTDETGAVVPGDILGQIAAVALGAQTVVTPVSSNTGIDLLETIDQVRRTRIGSPYVISGMQEVGGNVVGYEANGGFLLGFNAQLPDGALAALMTRDAILPAILALKETSGGKLSDLVAAQPARFTAADRLQDVDTALSQSLIQGFVQDSDKRAAFLSKLSLIEKSVDLTDGLRITLQGDRVLHVRPSGNAPELRVYTEAETATGALDLLHKTIGQLGEVLL